MRMLSFVFSTYKLPSNKSVYILSFKIILIHAQCDYLFTFVKLSGLVFRMLLSSVYIAGLAIKSPVFQVNNNVKCRKTKQSNVKRFKYLCLFVKFQDPSENTLKLKYF